MFEQVILLAQAHLWEYSLVLFTLASMVGAYLPIRLRTLALRCLNSYGAEIQPRHLPAHIRAEIQDLDEWTNDRPTLVRR